jgi:hypothetical protein
MPVRGRFPCGNRATGRHGPPSQAPMVNGVRLDMVNEGLFTGLHPVHPASGAGYTQPLSSRIASCQIMSMPASLSLRHGMAAKFWPP